MGNGDLVNNWELNVTIMIIEVGCIISNVGGQVVRSKICGNNSRVICRGLKIKVVIRES